MEELLRKLYESKWNDLCKAFKPIINDREYEIKPTKPLLLFPSQDYIDADFRVMIFGQETNDWCDDFDLSPDYKSVIETDLDIYDDFYNVRDDYVGQFWNGYRLFRKMLCEKYPNKKIGFIWNNIIKIGKSGSMHRPPEYIYKIEKEHFSVVKKEVEILKPDVILFLTGPNYDQCIKDKFGELKVIPLGSYNYREATQFDIPNVKKTFRLYHPRYSYMKGKGTIESYFENVINNINY